MAETLVCQCPTWRTEEENKQTLISTNKTALNEPQDTLPIFHSALDTKGSIQTDSIKIHRSDILISRFMFQQGFKMMEVKYKMFRGKMEFVPTDKS